MKTIYLFTFLSSSLILATQSLAKDKYGYFSNKPAIQLENDGRNIKLLKKLTYFDPKGTQWPVPKGYTANGASIPRALYSLVGPPLVGRYRNASIIHDYYCELASDKYPHHSVHRMFYYASLAGGVSLSKASIMYLAVRTMGPRWGAPPVYGLQTYKLEKKPPNFIGEISCIKSSKGLDEDSFKQAISKIKGQTMSLSDMDKILDETKVIYKSRPSGFEENCRIEGQ